jgi:hypothetical protein
VKSVKIHMAPKQQLVGRVGEVGENALSIIFPCIAKNTIYQSKKARARENNRKSKITYFTYPTDRRCPLSFFFSCRRRPRRFSQATQELLVCSNRLPN